MGWDQRMAMTNNARLGLGALVAVVIGVGLVALVPKPTPPVITPEVAAPVAAIPAAPAQVIVIAPKLDTFRVEPDGTSVLAGRAAPLQEVAIVLDGQTIEIATADTNGSFVAFPVFGYADTSRTLTLIGDPNGQAIASEDTYFIAPITPPVVVAAAPEAETPTVAPEVEPAPPAQPAPAVIVATPEGVKVAQPASNIPPEVLSNVALDSITYDPSGDVLIAGRASGRGNVQVYLDNQPITTSRIAADGNWRTDLPQIDTGVYTLRVDEVSEAGKVISRVETPFQREDPVVVAAQIATQTQTPDFQVAMTTVQPGTSLWAIAQDRFGDGILYFKVFEANRDRIRDPDLIYPGQVFRIPQGDE